MIVVTSSLSLYTKIIFPPDNPCSHWHCTKQCHYHNIPSLLQSYGCLRCTVSHTNSNLFSRSSTSFISMVNNRNHSIWILCAEHHQARTEFCDFFEVMRKSEITNTNNQFATINSNCRYTTFIILYPIGVTGELLCFYWAQSYAKENTVWTLAMPNAANFTFNYFYFLWMIMLAYIPLFPMMYMHMVSQRKKVLGGGMKCKKN